MTTRTTPVEPIVISGIRDYADEPRRRLRGRAWIVVGVALVASAFAITAAAIRSSTPVGPGRGLSAALIVVWCLCAVAVARRRPDERFALLMTWAALTASLAVLGATYLGRELSSSNQDLVAALRAVGCSLLPAAILHLALSLPNGRLATRPRLAFVALGYAGAIASALVLYGERPDLPLGSIAGLAAYAAAVGSIGFLARWSRAALPDRPRFQWAVWGVTVAVVIGLGGAASNVLFEWPRPIMAIAVGATAIVPIALAAGAAAGDAVRIDRLLVHTITLAGLLGLVGLSYLVIVLGLGRSPSDDEQSLLGLSMLAAAIAALLWVPARARLNEFATRRVYGERHAPDEVIRTFGSRLTRALPLDELLLQLAESLTKTMALDCAEVWTRSTGGGMERAVSLPERGTARLSLSPEEEPVVARAGVSGPAWARVWLPAVISDDVDDAVMRVAPVTNSGQLLGLLVVRRPDGAPPFDEDDDQALTDLARQVGLALHNVKLDSALQESLDEVQRQADELRASRARIVEAGDAQRRSIERDLHDGAQQHLVALAVSVRLARQVADTDPAQAKSMLEQIGTDLQDAVQELRNLAHGIYPPLLMDRGLPEALTAAAGRSALPTTATADGVGRYPQPIEAAVYFCCLEALQNAGKHAGDGAQATVSVREDEGALLFEVADNGAGFDMASGAQRGHGFVNMTDRVGAIGGTVTVDSAPGKGTRISGRIPLAD